MILLKDNPSGVYVPSHRIKCDDKDAMEDTRELLRECSGEMLAFCAFCGDITMFRPIKHSRRTVWLCENELANDTNAHVSSSLTLRGTKLARGTWKVGVRRGGHNMCEMAEDGHVCSGYLSGHHMVHQSYAPELRSELANGLCVCRGVHDKIHSCPRYELACWDYLFLVRPEDADYLKSLPETEEFFDRLDRLRTIVCDENENAWSRWLAASKGKSHYVY